MSNWISVKGRTPPCCCIVQTETGDVTSGLQYHAGWIINGVARPYDYVTHWQPLPDPVPPEPPSLARRIKDELDRRGLCIGTPRVQEIIDLVDAERAKEPRIEAKHLETLAKAANTLSVRGRYDLHDDLREIIAILRREVV